MTDAQWAAINWKDPKNWKRLIRDLKAQTNPAIKTLRQTINTGGSLSPVKNWRWWSIAGRSRFQLERWRSKLGQALVSGEPTSSLPGYRSEAYKVLPKRPVPWNYVNIEWSLFDSRRTQVEKLAAYQLKLLTAAQIERRRLLGKQTKTAAQVKQEMQRSTPAAVRTPAPKVSDILPIRKIGLYVALVLGVMVLQNQRK